MTQALEILPVPQPKPVRRQTTTPETRLAYKIAELQARQQTISEVCALLKTPVVIAIGGVVMLHFLHEAGVITDVEYDMLKIGDLAIAGGMAAGGTGAAIGAALGGASDLSSRQIKTALTAAAGTSIGVILLSALAAL